MNKEDWFSKSIVGIRARAYYKSNQPLEAIKTLKDSLEDGYNSKNEDDMRKLTDFIDLGELEVLMGHLGHAFFYFGFAKRILTKNSTFFAHLARTLGTLEYLNFQNLSPVFELENRNLDSCKLLNKNETNKSISDLMTDKLYETKCLFKGIKNQITGEIENGLQGGKTKSNSPMAAGGTPINQQPQISNPNQSVSGVPGDSTGEKMATLGMPVFTFPVNDSPAENNIPKTIQEPENLIDLAEPNEMQVFSSIFSNTKIFAELQENQNEIRQYMKTVFNRDAPKSSEKDVSKAATSLKKDKTGAAPQSNLRPFLEYTPIDFRSEKKLTQVAIKELPQNKRSEYPSIYDDRVEQLIKINFRTVATILAILDKNPDLLTVKRRLSFQLFDYANKLLAENSVIFTKNYYLPNCLKAEGEFYQGRLLKLRAKGVLLQGLIRSLEEYSGLANMDNLKYKVARGDVINYYNLDSLEALPGYRSTVSKHFMPLLKRAKEKFLTALLLFKFENVLTEFVFQIQDVFWELAETNLWMIEHGSYRPFKYLTPENIMDLAIEMEGCLTTENYKAVESSQIEDFRKTTCHLN